MSFGNLLPDSGSLRVRESKFESSVGSTNQVVRWERLDGVGLARYGELNQLGGAAVC
jgi:hypothetical protein